MSLRVQIIVLKILLLLLLILTLIWWTKFDSLLSALNGHLNTQQANSSIPNTNKTDNSKLYTGFGILNTLSDLATWALKEEKIFPILSNKLELLKMEKNIIQNYLQIYKNSSGVMLKSSWDSNLSSEETGKPNSSNKRLSHDIASRHFRVLADIQNILTSLEYKYNQANLTEIFGITKSKTKSTDWIGTTEVFMSMVGINHIQEVSFRKPDEVTKGIGLEPVPFDKPTITANDAAELGAFYLYREYFHMSVEWLEFAVNQTKTLQITGAHHIPTDLALSLYLISVQQVRT